MPDKKIKTLIVDDEPLAREYVRSLLENDREIEIAGERGDGRSALEFIKNEKPDLIFLDVQMPEMNGFEMLESLGAENLPAIIFTTAFEEYAIRAFEFHALDYLLKPFDESRFRQSLNFAKERLNTGERETGQIGEMLKSVREKPQFLERLLIKQNGRIVFLHAADIDFIKADDKYVEIYHAGQTKPHLVRQTLTAMKSQLDPRRFAQTHRSAIVNLEKIKELETVFGGDYAIVMQSGARLAVGKNYKDELFSILGKPL